MLIRHFLGDPTEPRVAPAEAVRVFFRHLDAFALLPDLITHSDAFVHRSFLPGGNGVGGAVVLVAWMVAAGWAWRHRRRRLCSLNAVIAVALVVQLASISRIFGKVWYYLTLWAWGTMLLAVLAIGWTATALIAERRLWFNVGRGDAGAVDAGRGARVIALTVGSAATALSLIAAVNMQVPEPQLSKGLGLVIDPTVDAVEAGLGEATGRDGRYVVFWQDAVFIGAQGYGLVNELERRGLDVGVHPTWRVPVTPQRVLLPAEITAEIHLVSGRYIDEWRSRQGYEEVVAVDARSAAQQAEFDELRTGVIERLGELGRADLIEEIDINLFGASLDPELPRDVVDDLSEMLLLGEPIAVFIAPAGSTT
jgi:hypothetical protein